MVTCCAWTSSGRSPTRSGARCWPTWPAGRGGSSTSPTGRPISRPAVSKHLRLLLEAGAVTVSDAGPGALLRARPGARSSPVVVVRRRRWPRPARHRAARSTPSRPRSVGPPASGGPAPPPERTRRRPHDTQHRPIEQRDGQHVLVQTRDVRRADRGRLGGGDRARAAGPLDRLVDRRPGVRGGDVPDAVRGRGPRRRGRWRSGSASRRTGCTSPRASARRSGCSSSTSRHADGVTTLTFSQPGVTAEQVGDVGPGWDYYLDRLVDVETGADPALRDFDATTTRRPPSTTRQSQF